MARSHRISAGIAPTRGGRNQDESAVHEDHTSLVCDELGELGELDQLLLDRRESLMEQSHWRDIEWAERPGCLGSCPHLYGVGSSPSNLTRS